MRRTKDDRGKEKVEEEEGGGKGTKGTRSEETGVRH